jgi:beta-glucosidase-like glycosyl hydrolase
MGNSNSNGKLAEKAGNDIQSIVDKAVKEAKAAVKVVKKAAEDAKKATTQVDIDTAVDRAKAAVEIAKKATNYLTSAGPYDNEREEAEEALAKAMKALNNIQTKVKSETKYLKYKTKYLNLKRQM